MSNDYESSFLKYTHNTFPKISNDNTYNSSFKLKRKSFMHKDEIKSKIENNLNQDIIKLITKYNSFCSYYFNIINNTEYKNDICTKSNPSHSTRIFKVLGMNLTGKVETEFFCKFFLFTKDAKCCINSISAAEFTVENVLIWNFLNNLIYQNTRGVEFIDLKNLFNNFCNTHFNAIKSIIIVNKKFLSTFSPCTYTVYFPPIMDEVIPICNSIVKLACKFLNDSNPAQWSIQILVWISSLLRINDYNGVLKILITMVSILNNNNDTLKSSITYGVFPYFWEELLDMFLFIDQGISKSLINIVKAIPVCGIVFKSDISKKFFIEERVNLSIEFQNKLSTKVRDVESIICKSFGSKVIHNLILKNDKFDKFRDQKYNSLKYYRYLEQKKITMYLNSKFIYWSKHNKKLKFESANKNLENKYNPIQNSTKLKLNSRITSDDLEFEVIKYENSILTVNAICNNQIFRKGDVALIQPFNKQIAMNGRQIMSFRQLAIVLSVIFVKQSLKFKRNILTLKLKITDPGMDPSIYKHCVIIYLLNYYKYKKKTRLIRRYSLKFPQPYLSLIENMNIEIFEKLIYNSSSENKDINNKFVVIFSEKLKSVFSRQEIFDFNNCFFVNKRQELFSYLLNFPNIDCNVIKKILYLTELQKHIILLALNSIAIMINSMNYINRINIISMIAFCKKIIIPNTKILILASRFEYAKMIKHALHTLNISSKILEEEYLLFKAENIKFGLEKKNFKELPRYENWLNREMVIEEYDIIIINNIKLNYNFVKKKLNFERKPNERSYFDHLFIENIGVLSRLDILLLFILPFNNITLFSS
ncbi:putative low complexity [Cryptosporidium sp. chipmunk genotype I]|uniref:putative low complexity n=1 Tax=Cryptosporidium sp. chipmunk genotype I TaxID=1280935 RepID=UPI003519F1FE|nr:putative low complexity [Cryptosporidium sp. chipmunk genotype I]